MDDILKPGDEVVRGPDWIWSDQDGGPGTIGIVVKLDATMQEETWYIVEWPNGDKNGYVYEKDRKDIIRIKVSKPIKTKEPEGTIIKIQSKIKRMNNGEFKNALKDLK